MEDIITGVGVEVVEIFTGVCCTVGVGLVPPVDETVAGVVPFADVQVTGVCRVVVSLLDDTNMGVCIMVVPVQMRITVGAGVVTVVFVGVVAVDVRVEVEVGSGVVPFSDVIITGVCRVVVSLLDDTNMGVCIRVVPVEMRITVGVGVVEVRDGVKVEVDVIDGVEVEVGSGVGVKVVKGVIA